MQESKIPGTRYQLLCPACGASMPTIFFEASFYDYDTYIGTATGTLYRLDLTSIDYAGVTEESAIAPAKSREREAGGYALRLRDHISCTACNCSFRFDETRDPSPGESVEVSAISLPVS